MESPNKYTQLQIVERNWNRKVHDYLNTILHQEMKNNNIENLDKIAEIYNNLINFEKNILSTIGVYNG